MKKIVGIILGMLVLGAGLIGCASCKPEEPDPHEPLYGVYKLIENEYGIEVRKEGDIVSYWPQEVQDKIDEVLAIAGDTITITKDKVSFSGGNKQPEFKYYFAYWDTIYFEGIDFLNRDFPFYFLEIEDFTNYTVFQLLTQISMRTNEKTYIIHFYYS